MLDTFLLALYASMVPVVYLQFKWLADWINVSHYGAVAVFMGVSLELLVGWPRCDLLWSLAAANCRRPAAAWAGGNVRHCVRDCWVVCNRNRHRCARSCM